MLQFGHQVIPAGTLADQQTNPRIFNRDALIELGKRYYLAYEQLEKENVQR